MPPLCKGRVSLSDLWLPKIHVRLSERSPDPSLLLACLDAEAWQRATNKGLLVVIRFADPTETRGSAVNKYYVAIRVAGDPEPITRINEHIATAGLRIRRQMGDLSPKRHPARQQLGRDWGEDSGLSGPRRDRHPARGLGRFVDLVPNQRPLDPDSACRSAYFCNYRRHL